MIDGDHWFYTILQQQIYDIVVVIDGVYINFIAVALWKYAAPWYREAIEIYPQIFEDFYILPILMVRIASYVSIGFVFYYVGVLLDVEIPNVFSFSWNENTFISSMFHTFQRKIFSFNHTGWSALSFPLEMISTFVFWMKILFLL